MRSNEPTAGDLLAMLSILAVVAAVFWFYGLPLVAQFLIASKAFLTS